MAEMGKYCKAYLLKALREFSGWVENSENARQEKKPASGEEVTVSRELRDDSIMYIHENYVVTDGIFKDENIIYDEIVPEWIEFCQKALMFEVPEDLAGLCCTNRKKG